MSPARRAAVAASKPPHLRAVLWDLDGTLTDSVRLVVESTARTWRELRAAVHALGGPKPGILGRRGPL